MTTHIEAPAYPNVPLFINGKWHTTEKTLDIINPANETVIGQLSCATRLDLDGAVAAAKRGLVIWRTTSAEKRAAIMLKAAGLIRTRCDHIAAVMTMEQGKPIEQSRLEVQRACDIIEWDANEGRRLYGRQIPGEYGMMHIALREPIGVVAAFSPWNFPISSPARKIAGALAAGCSIVLKASEETPAAAMLMVKAFEEAGLPPGVLNLVFGIPADISSHLIAHPDVRLVTFTGSIPVGKALASLAGQYLKPTIMELGGHGPVFICEDVDVEGVARKSAFIKSRNAGQVCVAPTRFFVHESIHERFVKTFAHNASEFRIGNGLDPQTSLGPLANARRLQFMEQLVADAVAHGAQVASGGKRHGNAGFYYPLTVLANIPDGARCMTEEPFGPLALVNPVASLEDAIRQANSLPFGLAAYGFTHNADHVATMMANVECGNLSINHFVASVAETPFGGVKDSGYGREGGVEGLQAYTTVKNVSHLTRPSRVLD
ncbi:NAD-dependent succinate-semialdehyde dehydrogenase [Diaphorobacter sp. HDW4A]|uniref:NAD-dependent succinate-semialdehyde dehydrogenase n=1 Tax=Diaphorobacter sp. HDW4A TaxID=2714924 RepID=UPI00140874CE|nr:NAD-dependent succinate-semialdehyde dehydrogenase [Diaphorobacter sp. HDW4A]QIL79294.1 NAD-dependent succinate-semialdehyde dehydrogenase [Diaphorobacter sp. HDW4A]